MDRAEIVLFVLMSLVMSGSTQGNYNPTTDGVIELSQTNFKTQVLNSGDFWVVIFEYSGCDYCTQWSEVVKKALPTLKEKKIKVGFVEIDTVEGQKLANSFGLTGFPVMYLFGIQKESPIKFPFSPSSSEELANAIIILLNRPLPAEGHCGIDSPQSPTSDSPTLELTDENFEEVVLKCEGPWLVNFYSPGDELCDQFETYFQEAARKFLGRARFGSLFMMGSKVAEKFNKFDGYNLVCVVVLFPGGSKNDQPVHYNNGAHGPSINANLIPWLDDALGSSPPLDTPAPGPPAPNPTPSPPAPGRISELTDQTVLDSKCRKSEVHRCVFLFLADQCNSECKSSSLNLLTQLADDMEDKNLAWLWTSEARQNDFEQSFGVKGVPGVFGVDLESNTYSVLPGTPDKSKLKEFVQSFVGGRLASKNLMLV